MTMITAKYKHISWPAMALLLLATLMISATVSAFFFSCSSSNNLSFRLTSRPEAIRGGCPSSSTHRSQYHGSSKVLLKLSSSSDTTNEMKALGNSLILSAARYHGATDKMITIDWKSDRIIVTVDVNADETYVAGGGSSSVVVGELQEGEEGDLELEYDDDDFEYEYDLEYEDDDDDGDFEDDDEEDFETLQAELGLIEEEQPSSQRRIDLTLIARTINQYLSEGDDYENTLQFKIAQLHEIEVTTPEFDNVLRVDYNGLNMFQVYKGFDVIVDYWEVPKKKKVKKGGGKAGKEVVANNTDKEEEAEEEEPKKTQKVIEGKLVGRDEEKGVTLVNVKGRIMKIKNDMIESVKLPKAKREKGAK
jgi:hypothetical protein